MKIKPFSDKQIEKWIKQGKKVYCFGAGAKFKSLWNRIPGFAEAVVALGDNNKKLWGVYLNEEDYKVIVKNPEEIVYDGESVILLTTAFYREVSEQLKHIDSWNKVECMYFFPQAEEMHYYRFAWFYEKLKPKKKMMFRSGNYHYVPGWDYNDNAKALFDYMIEHDYNDEYEMIWLVHDPKEYPQIGEIKNAKAVSYEWAKNGNLLQKLIYYYHLRTSKYLFFTDAMYWTKFCSEDQIRVNLWHGNGFKAKKNKKGAALDAFFDYTTVSGPVYIDLHTWYLGCQREKIYDTGLAKEDLLFKKLSKPISEILNIPKTQKYVFWLPTFRQTVESLKSLNEYQIESVTGMPILTTDDKVAELNELLHKLDMVLIIKLHPVQDNTAIQKLDLSNIKVLTHAEVAASGYQINELLSEADALISDFSSIAIDYVLKDKPLAFVLEDEDLYKESRGFVFEPIEEYLPGREIYNFEDMASFLTDVSNDLDTSYDKRHRLQPMFHTHNDGNSCHRIMQMIGLEE